MSWSPPLKSLAARAAPGRLASTALGAICVAAVVCIAQAAGVSRAAAQLERESRSMKAVCGKCHNLQIVMDTPKSYDEWRDTVQQMVDRGARGSDAQFDDIMDYLRRTMTTIDVNSADADELQTVLNLSDDAAKAVIARRTEKKLTGLAELKSLPGVDAATIDAKARLIFFQ